MTTAQNLRELHDLRQLVFPKEREELLRDIGYPEGKE